MLNKYHYDDIIRSLCEVIKWMFPVAIIMIVEMIIIELQKSFFYIVILIILLLLLCRKKVVEKIQLYRKLYKDIHNKKYFFITDRGYKIDLKKRFKLKEHWFCLFSVILVILFPVYLKVYLLKNPFETESIEMIIGIITIVIIFTICYCFFKNRHLIYYYGTPMLGLMICGSKIEDYNNLRNIGTFVLFVLVVYIVITLLLPLYSLRKITSTTWIFGALITLSIGLAIDVIGPICLENGVPSVVKEDVTWELIKKFLPNDIFFAKEDLRDIVATVNIVKDMIIDYVLYYKYKSILIVEKLILFSYSVGLITIKIKIKLGESKAGDIYDKIIKSKNVEYMDLKECVFYGGEKYENRIMSDRYYRQLILCEEKLKYDITLDTFEKIKSIILGKLRKII